MKPLLICGSARCLWDDLARVGRWDGSVMAINRAAFDVPFTVEHWVSAHADFFEPAVGLFKWIRRDVQSTVPITHSIESAPGVISPWLDIRPHDYSGYFACRVALALGYGTIVLAGIPMDASGHYYDNGPDPNGYVDQFPMNEVWDALPAHCIRSMSGKTRDKFGEPAMIGRPYATVSAPRHMQIEVTTAPQAA